MLIYFPGRFPRLLLVVVAAGTALAWLDAVGASKDRVARCFFGAVLSFSISAPGLVFLLREGIVAVELFGPSVSWASDGGGVSGPPFVLDSGGFAVFDVLASPRSASPT